MFIPTYRMFAQFLFSALVVPKALALPKQLPEDGIVGGAESYPDQFPFMASIIDLPFGIRTHRCGGAFIAPNLVLTAGRTFLPLDQLITNFILSLINRLYAKTH